MSGTPEALSASADSLLAEQERSRNQHVVRSDSHRSVPATTAAGLAPHIDPATVTWDETLGAGQYGGRVLRRDTVLRFEDRLGDACTQLLIFNAHLTSERFNPADTMKVPWNAYISTGSLLLSDLGRVLMTVVDDSSSRHDGLCGGSNRKVNDTRYGDGGIGGSAPNARDLLTLAAGKHGLSRVDIGPCLNLFKKVRILTDGSMAFDGDVAPGRHVELRAELDVIVLVANTPHRLDDRPDYTVSPVRVTAYRPERPFPDPFRGGTPERTRIFENTESHLREVMA